MAITTALVKTTRHAPAVDIGKYIIESPGIINLGLTFIYSQNNFGYTFNINWIQRTALKASTLPAFSGMSIIAKNAPIKFLNV